MKEIQIVVADDDEASLRLVRTLLERAGYGVFPCSDGTDAFGMVLRKGSVILLSDWEMPGLTGVELCRKIRASEAGDNTYIVLLTANGERDQIVTGFEAGADDYLVKPFAHEELLARVRAGERVLRLLLQQREHATALESKNAALEAAKRQAEDALAQLEQAQSQLLQADKMASIGQLAAGVAHEINNPIGFISSNLNSLGQYVEDIKRILRAHEELLHECQQGNTELATKVEEVTRLRDESDVDFIVGDLDSLVNESIEGTRRVRQIVADLRDFSHVDSPDITEENINELLDKTINVAWNELKYKTEVVREYGPLPEIPCYGGKLGQVFLNVLVNAAQAIEERGTITIRTRQISDRIRIEVVDSGNGILPENLKRIFDPFFTTKEVGKGTGMGLHLAYKIIEAHGGRISAESVVGQGTTFRIELPIAGPPEAKEKQHESTA